jgi:hypothetical protein
MDLQALVELETMVWDALQRGDADADSRLLSDDFLGVYSSGFAGRSDHAGPTRRRDPPSPLMNCARRGWSS